MSFNLKQHIEKNNMTGMSFEQYEYLFNFISSKNGINLLVFGLGRDSYMWNFQANKKGRTAFLEDVPHWIDQTAQENPGIEIWPVVYPTACRDHESLLKEYEEGNQKKLFPNWPLSISNTIWDIIIIDGPMGYNINNPGRMIPIASSFHFQKEQEHGDIFVHDASRKIESKYSEYFFTKNNYKLKKNIEFNSALKSTSEEWLKNNPTVLTSPFVSLNHFQK
jgi:uncharacterized protein (TIGR01627 family)